MEITNKMSDFYQSPRFVHFKKHKDLIKKFEEKKGTIEKQVFSIENEKLTKDRILMNRIPSMFFDDNVHDQRKLIVKYFEDDVKYAKIIPRTISFIYQLRKTFSGKENLDQNEVEAFHLVDLIKKDDEKLESISPITRVQFVDSNNQ